MSLYYIWQRNLEEIQETLEHINSTLTQGVRTTLKGHELLLRGLGKELIKQGALEQPENGRALIERMHSIDPGMVGFGLAKPDGQLVLVSQTKPNQKLPNLAIHPESRDSFIKMLQAKHLMTGRVYFFKSLNDWAVPIRAPIFDSYGKIIAVMTAGYHINNASAAWSNTDLPENIQTAVMRDDGYMIFAQPLSKSVFKQAISTNTKQTIKRLNKQKSFIRLVTPRAISKDQYLSYRYIEEYKLHTGTMIGYETVVNYWLKRILIPSLLFLFFLIGGAWAFYHANKRQKQADRELEFQANNDNLTGLPNREYLHTAFAEHEIIAKKNRTSIALLLFDLDRFKEINDTLGHIVGDTVLKKVGLRLKKISYAEKITIARLGGDEFAILCNSDKSLDEISSISQKYINGLREPFSIKGISISLNASVGIACYPVHGQDFNELLRAADVAMYQAKKSNQGIVLYDQQFDIYSTQRLSLANELSQAVKENQLILHYQPKIEVSTGNTLGFEALVRWQHPTRGLLFPDAFIDLVEMSEIVHAFTQAVIKIAVKDKNKLHQLGYLQPVAINLSARNLHDESCLNSIRLAVKELNLPINEIEMELTESAVMDDPQRAISILNKFKQHGINIAVDDFGTGYSSLAYLRQLPVSALKIDREFVMDMTKNIQDKAIVKSTIALAHSLDLKVIAEGVEDENTRQILSEMNCDLAQGYGICRPQPLDKLVNWLSTESE